MRKKNDFFKSSHIRLVINNQRSNLAKKPSQQAQNREKQNLNQGDSNIQPKDVINRNQSLNRSNASLNKRPLSKQVVVRDGQKQASKSRPKGFSDFNNEFRIKQGRPLSRGNDKSCETYKLPQVVSEWEIQSDQIITLANELYGKMCEQSVIQPKGAVSIVKRQKFIEFINRFIENLSLQEKKIVAFSPQQANNLASVFRKIKKYVQNTAIRYRRRQLSYRINNISLKLKPEDYQLKLNNIVKQIEKSQTEKQKVKNQVDALKVEFNQILELHVERKKQLTSFYQRLQTIKGEIQKYSQKYQSIKNKVSVEQAILDQIDRKTQQITNFVQHQQQKKVLHWVSQSYKKIQAQIYDYASNLQCNAIASSLTWEPKPFRAVEEWTMKQMERVNKLILQKGIDADQKQKAMKDFVLNTMRKFKTKDQEMMKITDFKTQCIKKFISMMQKWMQNWELKQQYLVQLRKQFSVQSGKINEIICSMIVQEEGKITGEQLCKQIGQMKQLWQKVEANYKYGNSFY